MRSQIEALGLGTSQKLVALNKAVEQLAAIVKAGDFGPYAATATIEYRRQIPDFGAGMSRAGRVERFRFAVEPGTEQAVIDALIDWRAQTCVGG